MCKDRFLFFENYYNIAEKLPDDLRTKFYDALMRYIFRDEEPEDVVVSALITAIKPSLDKEDTRGGYREGAGRKPNQSESNEIKKNQKESKLIKINQSESNDNQNNQSFLETGNKKQETGSIKEKDNLKVITKEKFTKPTLEEIKSYFAEKGYVDESEVFYDFYNSKGWVVGKSPMKDWRAAVRNWGRRNPSKDNPQSLAEENRANLWKFVNECGGL